MKKKRKSLEIPPLYRKIGKALQGISHSLAASYATQIFSTPLRFRMPKREETMFFNSKQWELFVPSINKKINIYEYGNAPKKVLFVHGWNGRGTQMVTLADFFLSQGYTVISFDAPAHGKSSGRKTYMGEFIASILEINNHFGSFDGIVGHSLGGISAINAVNMGFKTPFLISIAAADIVEDMVYDFVGRMELKKEIGRKIHGKLNKKIGHSINRYSASIAIRKLAIPILLIHDEDDPDVPITAAYNIHKNAPHSELFITNGLGHNLVLADEKVISKVSNFLQKHG